MNIAELSKSAVLAALYNASKPQGMGFMHFDPKPMTEEEASELLTQYSKFDYLKGQVMKIDMKDDEVDTWGYNRDNGENAAETAVDTLRKTSNVSAEAIANTHKKIPSAQSRKHTTV